MITCKFCNANCDDDMNYCYICGIKLVKDIPEPVPIAEPIPEPKTTPIVESVPEPQSTPIVEPIPEPEPTPIVEPIPEPEPTPVVEPVPEPEPAPVVEPVPEPEPAPAEKGKKVLSAFVQATEWIFAIFGMILTIAVLASGNVVSAFILLLSAFMISPLAEKNIPFLKEKGVKAFLIQIVIAFVLLLMAF